jgi:glycosyltransferase involved in cell wall biosynthesis
MRQARDGVLCLVPGCVKAGGIQASGALGWQAVQASFTQPFRFCYGDAGPPTDTNSVHAPSRARAVLAAATLRRQFGLVVVWHMDLLKLLPFFRQRAARVILILQGIEGWRRRAWPERALLRQVDLFLSISDYTWQRFVRSNGAYADAPHHTVLLGVGSPMTGQIPPANVTPAALMLSRLERREDYKGHREMLDAWPFVLQRVPNAELWIAGDGDLRPDLERLVSEQGIGHAVRFLGFVSEERKEALLRDCRTMAIPSRGEGFGLVYLEAMRVGRPCLVSTLDAGQEVVRPPEHGLAVDPDDRASLVDALCRLLSEGPDWQQLCVRARERYEHNFSAAHYQQRLVSALASVAT